MIEILKKGYATKQQRRGRHQKLSTEDLLLATLENLRKYRTYAHMAASYDIEESNVYRGIRWGEDTLIKDGTFSWPGRKALLESDVEYDAILVDTTETPIERTKKQRKFYSGKKKRCTLKTQMLINPENEEIISLAFAKGKVHDFQLFKISNLHLKPGTQLTVDSGHQGLTKLHTNSVLPKKSTKNRQLSKHDRKQNRNISRKRIAVEHVIGLVKRFRILSERYRNRRKRVSLRFSLVAGICNFEQRS